MVVDFIFGSSREQARFAIGSPALLFASGCGPCEGFSPIHSPKEDSNPHFRFRALVVTVAAVTVADVVAIDDLDFVAFVAPSVLSIWP